MDYLWLKALHVAAVLTWVGGMTVAALTAVAHAAARRQGRTSDLSGTLALVRRWDRRVTSPAMILVWALGLTLAFQGDWFGAPWLMAKLALVLLLSGVHGVLSGSLRRLAWDEDPPLPSLLPRMPLGVLAAAFAIVFLVVVKPW